MSPQLTIHCSYPNTSLPPTCVTFRISPECEGPLKKGRSISSLDLFQCPSRGPTNVPIGFRR